jgi:CubicO group peptidase (beta-lactamase class C family)
LAGGLVFWLLFTHDLAPLYAQGPPPGAPEAAFRRALELEIPRTLHEFRVPGIAVGTVIHGDPGQVYAYGLADKARGRPMTGRTVFQVASLSKSVTAWGVLTLVDSGKVDLDQPARRYLGAWPLASARFPSNAVTVRDLLTHTAGVNAGQDEYRRPGEPASSPAELLAREGAGDRGRPTPATLVAPAGKTFIYSTPGYTILQMLIEHQSGRPFKAYMRDDVLQPLGMTSSSYAWDVGLRNATATPYLSDGRASPMLVPEDAAADGLFSTVGDLVKFVAAPVPGRGLPAGAGVISDKAAREIFLPPARLSKAAMAILGPDAPCMGCFIERSAGGPTFVTNTGLDPGWSTAISVEAISGDGLVTLTNSSSGALAIAQVEAIWASWRGLPPPQLARSLRDLAVMVTAFVSLTSALLVSFAISCINGIVTGRRRFAAFNRDASVQSLVDLGLVGVACYEWSLVRAPFDFLQGFAMHLQVNLAGMVLMMIARAMFPETNAAAHTRAGAGDAAPGR